MPVEKIKAFSLCTCKLFKARFPRQLLLHCSTSCIHAVVLTPLTYIIHRDVVNADLQEQISVHVGKASFELRMGTLINRIRNFCNNGFGIMLISCPWLSSTDRYRIHMSASVMTKAQFADTGIGAAIEMDLPIANIVFCCLTPHIT